MPERWQQELRKLGDVEPADDTWHRAELGPRIPGGPGLPPRRQRVVAGVVAIVIFVAAGGFAWRALRPTPQRSVGSDLNPTLVVTLRILKRDNVSVPTATLKVGGLTVPGRGGVWQSGNAGTSSEPIRFTVGDFVPVVVGSLLGVAGDAESVDAGLERPDGSGSVASFGQLSDDAVALDQPPGDYVLRLTGHWLQGNANFYFPIDLVEQASGSPLDGAAVLTFVGKNAPTATIAYGHGRQELSLRTTYTWCEDPSTCVQGTVDYTSGYPPAVDYLPVPAGARLVINGDVTAVTGLFRGDGHGDKGAVDLNEGTIPATPGRYVLQLDVAFDRGTATFFLGVNATAP